MKCRKCGRTVQRKVYKGDYYYECRCGWSIAKPAELTEKEKANETGTAEQDNMDQR